MAHGTAQQGSALGMVAWRAVQPAAVAGQEEERLPWEQEFDEVRCLERRACEGGFAEEGKGVHLEGLPLNLQMHQQMH